MPNWLKCTATRSLAQSGARSMGSAWLSFFVALSKIVVFKENHVMTDPDRETSKCYGGLPWKAQKSQPVGRI